jgi:hypothetical protein
VPQWLFAETAVAALAIITLVINMKIMTWLVADAGAK